MTDEMGVSCDFASTTMLDVLEDATHVWAEPQSWDGGQPPHVCPQPSSPQVLALQFGVQLAPLPPVGVDPPEPLTTLPPEPELPPEPLPPCPVLLVPPEPVLPPDPAAPPPPDPVLELPPEPVVPP